jgi:hypothetical protein
VTGRVTPKGTGHVDERPPAVVRYRRWLVVPVLPILAFIGLFAAGVVTSLLPNGAARVLYYAVEIGVIAHAASRARTWWVVAIVVFPPAVVAYGMWFGLHLDERR